MGELAPQEAAAFLSGLLIASDIAGALDVFARSTRGREVHLIGSSQLIELYAVGLARQHCPSTSTDGVLAAVAGLANVRRELTRRSMTYGQ